MADYRFRAPAAAMDDPICVPALLEWCCALCREHSGGEENPIDSDMRQLSHDLELWVWVDSQEYLRAGARSLVSRVRRAGRRARLYEKENALHAWPVLCALRSVPQLQNDVRALARFLQADAPRG